MSTLSQQAINNAGQTGLYGVERTKQEAAGLSNTTSAYADQAKGALNSAVSSGQEKLASAEAQTSNAAAQLQADAAAKIDQAAAEGKHDTEQTKAATQGYIDQAKALAGTALGTAQNYLHMGATKIAPADPNAPGLVTTIQHTTSQALEATTGYLASAQAVIAGGVPQGAHDSAAATTEGAKSTAANVADTVSTTASNALNSTAATAQPYVEQAKVATQPIADLTKQAAVSAQQTTQVVANAVANQAAEIKHNVVPTTQGYADTAKASTEPYVAKAKEATVPYTEKAKESVQSKQPLADDLPARIENLKLNAEKEVSSVLKQGEHKVEQTKSSV